MIRAPRAESEYCARVFALPSYSRRGSRAVRLAKMRSRVPRLELRDAL
ncbi:MAG: hypothetical protein WDO69_19200 [Pseudomonadota bacterium]